MISWLLDYLHTVDQSTLSKSYVLWSPSFGKNPYISHRSLCSLEVCYFFIWIQKSVSFLYFEFHRMGQPANRRNKSNLERFDHRIHVPIIWCIKKGKIGFPLLTFRLTLQRKTIFVKSGLDFITHYLKKKSIFSQKRFVKLTRDFGSSLNGCRRKLERLCVIKLQQTTY